MGTARVSFITLFEGDATCEAAMADEPTRAWREAFCYWAADTLLAAVCAAAGGPLGLLVYVPPLISLVIITACQAFLLGLTGAAVLRAAVGKVQRRTLWMGSWVVFCAVARTA